MFVVILATHPVAPGSIPSIPKYFLEEIIILACLINITTGQKVGSRAEVESIS